MPLFFSLPLCEVMRTVYHSSFYLLGVDNKLPICLSIRKAVRNPYQLVSLSVKL